MNDESDARLRDLLQEAFHPPASAGLERDLWPGMLRRLDRGHLHRYWLDSVLGVAAGIWILVFPKVIPTILYHL